VASPGRKRDEKQGRNELRHRQARLTRKNALFAESDGKHWATIASLIATCKLNGRPPPTAILAT